MKVRRWLGVGALLMSAAVCADEQSLVRYLDEIDVDAGNSTFYFVSTAGWGAASCPNAKRAYARELQFLSALYAAALAAQAQGKPVMFYGTCDDSIYFRVKRIVVAQ